MCSEGGRTVNGKMVEETLRKIEDAQRALRECIDQSRRQARDSERLIEIRRKQVRPGS